MTGRGCATLIIILILTATAWTLTAILATTLGGDAHIDGL